MVFRRASTIVALILSVYCASPGRCAAPDGADVRPLIDALAHPDPMEREKAEKALVAMGSAARAAVMEATRSDDPELASRARGVLLRLPWALPTDSPNARQLLNGYNKPGLQRFQIIEKLVNGGEVSVLLRLLEEDPETETRWQIASRLSGRAGDLELERRLKGVAVDTANAPLAFLAAKRCENTDRPRARQLYRRVIELESVVSTPARNHIFDAFDELIRDEMRAADYAAAAALLREQAPHVLGTSYERMSGARLMALHAYFGPLPGFPRDVQGLGRSLGRPAWTDQVAALYGRLGLAPPPLLTAWAHGTAAAPPETRLWAGTFFWQHQLLPQAERELSLLVAAAPQPGPQADVERGAPPAYDYDAIVAAAHKMLSRLVGERGDDAAAAEHLRLAADREADGLAGARGRRVPGAGNLVIPPDQRDAAELHWRLLRAARSAGDQKKVREHLDVLKTMTPSNTDVILDVVPLLKEAGQPEAASRMFNAAYKELRELVDADPNNPEPLNNLAWLCSRSGERLEEALELATKAITLDPENPAYLDTAAEANFRVGNVDEAIRLETKGLQGRPNDKFMKEQLDRFKAAKK